jgi:phosphate acetyltransferase
VRIVLIGTEEGLRRRAAALGLDLNRAEIIRPDDDDLRKRFARTYYKLRSHKGITLDAAFDAMSNKTLFATMLVYEGMADGMVSGATHTTRETILPALETIKTRSGIHLVSSCFFMCFNTRVLLYADCAVNPDPDAAGLAEIAIASADTARRFGIEPRIAMLSYSTGESGVGSDVEKVRRATALVRQQRPDLVVDGPIQYDAAIDPAIGAKKMPGSPVAGRATVFIFPDLNTGNNTYKAVQRSAGAVAVGPILQGLNKPVNDLSRGCSIDDIVTTVTITAIQAQQADT